MPENEGFGPKQLKTGQKGVPEWPLGGVLGPPQTPDPLIGCGLLSISSVILDPQGPWEGSKMTHFGVPLFDPFWQVRARNDAFHRCYLDPSGQGGSEGGPKRGQKQAKNSCFGVVFDPFLDPLLSPPGQNHPNNTGEMRHFWPGPAKRGQKGVPQNGSFWTPPRAPGGPK